MKKLGTSLPCHLFGVQATRELERLAQLQKASHKGPSLMAMAGLSVAKLAMALKPHANCYWVLFGPGNNGGDGLHAAMHLHQWGMNTQVILWPTEQARPPDAAQALQQARDAGVQFLTSLPPHAPASDLCIDALLGIGAARALTGEMARWVDWINHSLAQVLSVDLPTGLDADTGCVQSPNASGNPVCVQAQHTLMLLSAKPGVFMAQGRDAAGSLWLDTLGTDELQSQAQADARLNTKQGLPAGLLAHTHASHKGSWGDVAVIGGESMAVRGMGMTGAVDLAASAALHAGAGRVMSCYLTPTRPATGSPPPIAMPTVDIAGYEPGVMRRQLEALNLRELTVLCGCGGGQVVRAHLPRILQQSPELVLDADALNAIAQDPWLKDLLRQRSAKKWHTVLTPHPLEAARLLGSNTASVQHDRLHAAQQLADDLQCVVLLKGSGSVIAAPHETPVINPTGNGRLATGGTGDVLAGLLAARMAQGLAPFAAACMAAFEHGALADAWPENLALTASALAENLR